MNDIRLGALAVAGSDAAGRKCAHTTLRPLATLKRSPPEGDR